MKKIFSLLINLIILSPIIIIATISFYSFAKWGNWSALPCLPLTLFLIIICWNNKDALDSFCGLYKIAFAGAFLWELLALICIIFELNFFIKIFDIKSDLKSTLMATLICFVLFVIWTNIKIFSNKLIKDEK